MNAKLHRTSSVVVVLVLVLAGALVQPFGGNAAAQSNSEGTFAPFLLRSGVVRSRRHAHRGY